ncbi:MAG: glutamate--tRNA ligase [Deltaproteobacteria bacterium]|nr:MAG: glutamate--tRNA ligase [Deltaproteobacteria bacterium]
MAQETQTPRLRFAPSPTGHLHIGGARTALFNWLYARQNKGTFVLRIEDTDRERSTDEYVHSIMAGMEWLQLDWNEGPLHQIDRMDLYKSYVEKLLNEGKAYKCFCTAEEIDVRKKAMLASGQKPKYDGLCRNANQNQQKPFCIRFISKPEGTTIVHDLIKGDVSFENAEMDDLVIQRTDGTPTYNFCVVIDDALMRITHIIRGDDHLNNTPRQILLYEAMGFTPAKFGHLPMILGSDKTRLSKRHGATSVLAYREMGFLPDALINFLARIGWSFGDQEIFSREELIEKFSFENVGTSGGVFNQEKLLWLNAHYLKNLDDKTLQVMVTPFLEKDGFRISPEIPMDKAIHLSKERSRTLLELSEALKFYLHQSVTIDPALKEKFLTPLAIELLRELSHQIETHSDFSETSLKAKIDEWITGKGLKLKDVAQPLRVALTGSTVSPGIFELMAVLGKEKVIQRLKAVS